MEGKIMQPDPNRDQHNEGHSFDGIRENTNGKPPAYFWILFYGLIIWGAIFSAFYLLSGWSSEAEFKAEMAKHRQAAEKASPVQTAVPAKAALPAQELLSQGSQLYNQTCAMCHGPEGKGGIGPDLTRETFTHGRTAEAVAETIAKGRSGGMPAYGNQLKPEQIQALTAFVLSLKP